MPPALPTQANIEVIYGINNISEWSDADNDGDAVKKAARVAWAIQRGYDYILGRVYKRFDISTFTAYPAVIFELIAKRAGIELYNSPRTIVDGDSAVAQIGAMSLQIEATLDQILSGQLYLIDAPNQAIDNPAINTGGDPFRSINRRYGTMNQWSGEPIVIPYGNFYVD